MLHGIHSWCLWITPSKSKHISVLHKVLSLNLFILCFLMSSIVRPTPLSLRFLDCLPGILAWARGRVWGDLLSRLFLGLSLHMEFLLDLMVWFVRVY